MSSRVEDVNGYWLIEGNPLTKAGVFQYLGSEIQGAPEPNRVYNVLRPPEELSRQETLNSFNLMPLIDDHTFLGKDGERPEKKGVQGVTGESATFEGGVLRNTLRIFSEYMKSRVRPSDPMVKPKTNLSASYRCVWDHNPGVYEGVPYEFIQRDIRVNHIALVDVGRTGPDVVVLDHASAVFESKESDMLTEEQLADLKQVIVETVTEAIKTILATPAEEVLQEDAPAEEAVEEVVEAIVEEVVEAAVEETPVVEEPEVVEDPEVKDEEDDNKVEDAAAVQADRDAFANRLIKYVGVFDTADMLTAGEVASYGVAKLGLKAEPGLERAVLEGYMQAVKPPVESIVADASTPSGPAVKGDLAKRLWPHK